MKFRVLLLEFIGASSEHLYERLSQHRELALSRRVLNHTASAEPSLMDAIGLFDAVVIAVPPQFGAYDMLTALGRSLGPGSPCIAVIDSGSEPMAVTRLSHYVDEVVTSDIEPDAIVAKLMAMLQSGDGRGQAANLRATLGKFNLLSQDQKFLAAMRLLPRIAQFTAPVLVQGETGSGKELCARAVHNLSPRSRGPFVPFDCGAVPEHLIENELFGHRQGAYTNAHADHQGVVAAANEGTLFLDEIDSLPMHAQPKLLRFLQEGTFRQLGSTQIQRSNVRIVAATNANLEEKVRLKHFRQDLFYRLNVLSLQIPPLRARPSDISYLMQYFLSDAASGYAHRELKLTEPAARILEAHDWPGNVRELQNVAHRLASYASGNNVNPAHVLAVLYPGNGKNGTPASMKDMKAAAVTNFEKGYLESLLLSHSGNVSRAAKAAGKDRKVFSRLMKKHGLTADGFKPQVMGVSNGSGDISDGPYD